jgi:hypothetical protein
MAASLPAQAGVGEMLAALNWPATCSPSLREVGADRLTARPARDTRSAMRAVLIGEQEQVDTSRPSDDRCSLTIRVALDEDSPFLLLAAAVVQQARVDQTHRCSANCTKYNQCQRAAISARLFLTAPRPSDRAWAGVWLDWLQYAAVKASLTPRQRWGY